MSNRRATSLTIETPEGVEFSYDLASPVTRALAWMVDAAAIMVLTKGAGKACEWLGNVNAGLGHRDLRDPVFRHLRGIRDRARMALARPDPRQAGGGPARGGRPGLAPATFAGDSAQPAAAGGYAARDLPGRRPGLLLAAGIASGWATWRPAPSWPASAGRKLPTWNRWRPPSTIRCWRIRTWPRRLRSLASPEAVSIAVEAVSRRDGYEPLARIELFQELAAVFPVAGRIPRGGSRGAHRRAIRAQRAAGDLWRRAGMIGSAPAESVATRCACMP